MEKELEHSMMLVDDDQFLLNMYSLKFGKSGYQVTAIPSPQDALKRLREGFAPDVILLDIIMPGLDGIELLQTIRNEKLAENSAVIMLTNQGDNIDRAKELGVEGYIVKATTIPSEVVTEVTDILKKKKQK